jgi:hypothetical protein
VRSLLERRAVGGLALPRPDLAQELAPIAGGALAALALVLAIVLERPDSAASFARGREHLIAAVVLLGSLAFALAGSLVVVLRRAPGAQR